MRKRIAATLGAAATAVMLTAGTASADTDVYFTDGFGQFTRSCDTTYAISLSTTKAVAAKGNNGSCDGHVWMRVHGDAWGSWTHSNTSVKRTSPSGKFDRAQIKGCSSCHVYTVYV
ncbi:hypothetical protein ABZT26_32810 [Streptomyces sp. NPDC005395]|uniref:hypothetical protein n=1 Tax=Streptomyces TaxID=1883 RepID=UPI00024771B4|nr:hypothetical protein [Streptomyces sp. R1]EHN79414.1 hypothetical protein SMCF_1010 [Streptomyces coelicoflavus ZG0656]KPC73123.1 hypothetical protein ADL35_28960 [Streptomyces sp. NRRL WC-3753]MCC8340262.1 hypothetical protein [Streptomyces sp. R1]MZE45172.1 hypothetical protein [Streptomyces sp. SID5477]